MCLRVDVQRALARLSERQRRVVVLIGVGDLSVRDAAEMMGIDRNACHRLYARTRRLLRNRLRPAVARLPEKK
jgi:RNA polymerase sigma factor (sigma-70 family)